MTRIYDISDQQYLWYLGLSENDCLKTWQLYWKTDYESSDLGCPILRQTHLRACTSSPVGFQQTYKRWFQLHKNCDFTEYWSPAMGNSAATRVILPVTSRILVANMKFTTRFNTGTHGDTSNNGEANLPDINGITKSYLCTTEQEILWDYGPVVRSTGQSVYGIFVLVSGLGNCQD